MKKIKHLLEFIFIIILFFIFKIIGSKNASTFGELIGRIFGPLFRSNFNSEKIKKNNSHWSRHGDSHCFFSWSL